MYRLEYLPKSTAPPKVKTVHAECEDDVIEDFAKSGAGTMISLTEIVRGIEDEHK